MTQIEDVEGIGAGYAKKLSEAGIRTAETLLKEAATASGRKAIQEKTGIDASQILHWANRVDMARVKGIGSEYAELLEAAGVDTVPELAQRNPESLLAKLTEVNEAKHKVRHLPTASQVAAWVEDAQKLERVIAY